MRYFAFVNASNVVRSTVATEGLPGDWGPRGNARPEGCIEISEEQFEQFNIEAGWRYVGESWVAPQSRKPMLKRAELFLLFPRSRRDGIRTYRRSNNDDDLEDFYELLGNVTEPLDLNDPTVSTVIGAGLSLLVQRGLITEAEAAAIAEGRAPLRDEDGGR